MLALGAALALAGLETREVYMWRCFRGLRIAVATRTQCSHPLILIVCRVVEVKKKMNMSMNCGEEVKYSTRL